MQKDKGNVYQKESDEFSKEIIAQKERITSLAEELVNELVDKKTIKRYGTSIQEGRTKEYIQKIEQKYYILKEEFDKIDKNSDHNLSKQELYNFFCKEDQYQGKNQIIDKNYIDRLFYLLDRDENSEISIEEFIFAYIKLEEKLSFKKTKLKLLQEDLKYSKSQYQDKFKKTENEVLNKDDICENASLSITLFEAKDLHSFTETMAPDTFVVLSLNGKKQQTNLQIASFNPQYNEDFTYPITKKGEVLTIEVYDQSLIYGNNLIGQVQIDLTLLEHQQKTENWYFLNLSGESPEGQGQIRLRLRYIYSWHKYYEELIKKTNAQIERLQIDIDDLDKYQKSFNKPFGIILAGEINDIIEKRMFEKSDDILDYIESTRKSIYISKNTTLSKNGIHVNKRGEIEWEKVTSYLLWITFFVSFFEFLSRSDFLGIIVITQILWIYVRNDKNDYDSKLGNHINGLYLSIAFDVIWLFFNWNQWSIKYYKNNVTLFIVYWISGINLVIKTIFVLLIGQMNSDIKIKKNIDMNEIMGNSSNP